MRRLWVILGIAALLTGFPIRLCGQMRMLPRSVVDSLVTASSQPKEWCDGRLSFESLTVDAGEVPEDAAPVKASFRFRNAGSETLLFDKPQASCSCVSVSLSKTRLRPGAEAVIDVTYRQKGHPGVHDRHVFLYYKDDTSNPAAALTLHSRVIEKAINH